MPSDRQSALWAWADAALAAQTLTPAGPWTALDGEASFRTFYRRRLLPASTESLAGVIAMDAPPDRENNEQFVTLARRFGDAGIGVPEIFAYDAERGFLLVEDLGTTLYESVYGTVHETPALEAALKTLIMLQRLADDPSVPRYTTERFIDELGLFRTWLLEGWLELDLSMAERALLDDLTHHLIAAIEDQPRVCVHRDFHSRNLIWRADATTGVVDFQDALWGPISYDLASLLRDCYVRFGEADIAHWRDRYLQLAGAAGLLSVAPEIFATWLDLTALQRQLKAMGIFARLKLRDDRDSHLADIPPVLDHAIAIARRYAPLAALASWLESDVQSRVAARA